MEVGNAVKLHIVTSWQLVRDRHAQRMEEEDAANTNSVRRVPSQAAISVYAMEAAGNASKIIAAVPRRASRVCARLIYLNVITQTSRKVCIRK